MGDQVTSRTPRTVDSANLYLATLDDGLGGATRHGAADRWDWGLTAESLARAVNRETQADRLVRQMSTEERAELWTGDGPEQPLLRRAARRMA